ncbi:PE family protein [Nocardia puris]|uniref:PE family protein n=1 Tax=Nocardia puris TaxID=208602 RepID=A0A366DRB3_9NOCA|nr:PE family protein [Nocardia puris]MBF6214215.1 PE family protein [Nocardia puris]MBF6365295.1 PE family protein [Nocardia puris]MBF6459697.1 PE family protein [Nocardia puris]RBO91758.1 PE family protein [Nocardia puris]
MVGHVSITPELVLAAAAELDLLADRLAAAAAVTGPATHVLPSGADEVSLLAAQHFNRAAGTHDHAVAQGILELHHAANVLRFQLATNVAEDIAKSAVMNAVTNTIV